MEDKKIKELEERLRNRMRYSVGVDTAAHKKDDVYYEDDYCEDECKCGCENQSNVEDDTCTCGHCGSKKDDYIRMYRVPMNYDDFMETVSLLFGIPTKKAYTNLVDAIHNAQELEKYINKKDEFYKTVSSKFKDIEKKFNENKLTKKDFSIDNYKPMSMEERSKKEKELIDRLKNNMTHVKGLMERMGPKKLAEYIPAGKVEDIEKEKEIDNNVIKGAKRYLDNPNDIPAKKEETKSNTDMFDEILDKMRETYHAKNTDYGSSFDKGIDRYGWTSFKTRIYDKFNRVESILDHKEQDPDYKPLVQDEKLEDTLMDMANYAILAILYLRTH
jgi:hypothetical protein